MIHLPRKSAVETFAGVVMIPESIDVFAPPTDGELRDLHAYIHEARVPTLVWRQAANQIGVDRVRDIKSILAMLGAWMHVLRWQWHETGKLGEAVNSWAIACAQVVVREKKIDASTKMALSLFDEVL